MRDVCLTCPLVRGTGGIAVYARTLLRALDRPVDVIGYLEDRAQFPLPPHARLLAVARNKAAYAAALARRVAGPSATFVHAHIGMTAPLFALPRRDHRHVLLLHGIEAWSAAPRTRALGLDKVDVLVFTTRFTRDMFLSHNRAHLRDDVRSVVIPLTVPPELEAEHPRPSPSGRRTIVCVTRLTRDEPLKGVSVLLRAARHLDPRSYAVEILGDGDCREGYMREAAALGVADRVTFRGFVPDEERTATIARADVLCLPSAQEGFGIVFLEAMVLGRPCVGAAAGAVPEVLAGDVFGLAPYGDDEALARVLDDVCSRFRAGEITPAAVRAFYDERYAFRLFSERFAALLAE